MKIKRILLTLSIVLLFSPSLLFAQTNEQITITTYYPSPNGVYNQLAANKFVVDIANMSEYGSMQTGDALIGRSVTVGVEGAGSEHAAMQQGDAHIWRSMIVGAGQGSGFAYDEGATLNDGNAVIKESLRIASTDFTNPLIRLGIHFEDIDSDFSVLSTGNGGAGLVFQRSGTPVGSLLDAGSDPYGGFVLKAYEGGALRLQTYPAADGTMDGADRIFITSDGKVGVGTLEPEDRLHVVSEDGNTEFLATDGVIAGRAGALLRGNSVDAVALNIQNLAGTYSGLQLINSGGTPGGYFAWDEPDNLLLLSTTGDVKLDSTQPDWGIAVGTPAGPSGRPKTDAPNGEFAGNMDVNDVWLRGADCTTPGDPASCAGRWASEPPEMRLTCITVRSGDSGTYGCPEDSTHPNRWACCPEGYTATGCGTWTSSEDDQFGTNSGLCPDCCYNNEANVWARCCRGVAAE